MGELTKENDEFKTLSSQIKFQVKDQKIFMTDLKEPFIPIVTDLRFLKINTESNLEDS